MCCCYTSAGSANPSLVFLGYPPHPTPLFQLLLEFLSLWCHPSRSVCIKRMWAILGMTAHWWLRWHCGLKFILHGAWCNLFLFFYPTTYQWENLIWMLLFPEWIGTNASEAQIDGEKMTHYKTIILPHKVFIHFWRPSVRSRWLTLFQHQRGALRPQRQNLGYLILEPGHICAVCWRWLMGLAELLANHAAARAISSTQLHKGPDSRRHSSSGSPGVNIRGGEHSLLAWGEAAVAACVEQPLFSPPIMHIKSRVGLGKCSALWDVKRFPCCSDLPPGSACVFDWHRKSDGGSGGVEGQVDFSRMWWTPLWFCYTALFVLTILEG